MASVVLRIGFVVGLAASGVVCADARRRDLSQLTRLLWIGSVGVVSFGGFLIPQLFDDALYRIYFANLKTTAVVTSPYEILALHLAVGVATSAVSVLLYGFGSRYDPLERR